MNRGDYSGFGVDRHYAVALGGQPSALPTSPDPTFVSMPQSEVRRLLDIEAAAQAAYLEMSDTPIERKSFIEAAVALDAALHSPVLGG